MHRTPRGAPRTNDERLPHLDRHPLHRPGRSMRRTHHHQRRTRHPHPRPTGRRHPRTPGRGLRPANHLRRPHRGRRVRRGPLHRPQEGRGLPLRDSRLPPRPRSPPHLPHRRQDGRHGRLHPRRIRRQPPDAPLRAARRPHHAAQALRHGRRRRHPRHRGLRRGELLRADPRVLGDRGARPRFGQLGHRRHRLLRRRHALHLRPQLLPAARLPGAPPRRRPQLHQPHAELPAQHQRAAHADLGRRIASQRRADQHGVAGDEPVACPPPGRTHASPLLGPARRLLHRQPHQLRTERAEGRHRDLHPPLAHGALRPGGVRARRGGRPRQADHLLRRPGHAGAATWTP